MSEEITIRNSEGTPIWYATINDDSIKLEFESYGRGHEDPDIESHVSIPGSEFEKIRENFGYEEYYPLARILQELTDTGRGEEFKDWAESNLALKTDFVWFSFDFDD